MDEPIFLSIRQPVSWAFSRRYSVGYYGVYSNVSRGKRKKLEGVETVTRKAEVTEIPPPLVSKELKKRWSYFIRKVYETDPLLCPKCSGKMRITSFIDQAEVIVHAKRNSLAHELHPGGLMQSKPRPRAVPSLNRIDIFLDIV